MKIGIIGLGKMGFNLALNLLDHNYSVTGFDANEEVCQNAKDFQLEAYSNLRELLNTLGTRKIVWVMVPSGEATESVLVQLLAELTAGDIVIEGGNSNYKDSVRRSIMFGERSIDYLDVGTSGGVHGARSRTCFMIGGEKSVFQELEALFRAIAHDQGYLYAGPSGSGHFLKMVHNGIEYGMMQAIGEGFHLLQQSGYDYDLAAVANVWNHGSVIRCWLMELAKEAFDESPDLEEYRGIVAASGEGKWMVETALEHNLATPAIALSLMLRSLSQEEESFSAKVVASLRNKFGGHCYIKKEV